jgi:hypothetical protein
VFLAAVLPRHTVRAAGLRGVLEAMLQGSSVKAAVEQLRLPFPLETFYHLLSRLRRRLDVLRCRLCGRDQALDSSQTDPLLQTVEHLQNVFKEAACPVTEFQVVFQEPLLG